MFPRLWQILILLVVALVCLSACGSPSAVTATPSPASPTQPSVPPTPTPPPLAATVNGEWITEVEFQAELDHYRAAQQTLGNDFSEEDASQIVLDDLIAQVLLAQAAREGGFEMTETELMSRIDALTSEAGGADVLATWQSEHGYTEETFQSALKRAAEAAWMRDEIIAAVPGTAEQVHAQQILLYNEDAAQTVVDQLSAGAKFTDLAVLYDPNTGGELGWFPRGYLLEPNLEEAAFSLEPGQYSDVIATGVGFHVILVVERDPQRALSPDAYLVMQENALQNWLEGKRTESDIVIGP